MEGEASRLSHGMVQFARTEGEVSELWKEKLQNT